MGLGAVASARAAAIACGVPKNRKRLPRAFKTRRESARLSETVRSSSAARVAMARAARTAEARVGVLRGMERGRRVESEGWQKAESRSSGLNFFLH